MRTTNLGVVVLASLWIQLAWASAPGPEARLEIMLLGRGQVPGAEILGWVLKIDGAPVKPAAEGWAGSLPPGRHTIGVQVHYWRELKTVIIQGEGDRVDFAFAEAGERWVGKEYSVDAVPASVVLVAATLDDNPDATDDRLLITHSVQDRSSSRLEQVPVEPVEQAAGAAPPEPSGARREQVGPTLAEQVQQRAASVAELVAPQLVRSGHRGDATVRVAVDRGGYLSDFQLESPSGDALVDGSVEQVLRLAAPYPPFEGYITVKLPFWTGRTPAKGPL